jgi:hypothetical protein
VEEVCSRNLQHRPALEELMRKAPLPPHPRHQCQQGNTAQPRQEELAHRRCSAGQGRGAGKDVARKYENIKLTMVRMSWGPHEVRDDTHSARAVR